MAGKFSIWAIFKGNDQVSKVISGIEAKTSHFTKGFAKSLEKIDQINSKVISGFADFAKKAGAVGAAAAFGLGLGLYEVMKTTNEVADGQARLSTVMTKTAGFSEGASARMKEAALDWADVHKTTAVEFEKSSYMMVSAGLNEEQALAGSRTAALVAAATFGDANEAAKALAVQYNTLGDKTKPVSAEMARLGDVMTRTQQVFQFENLDQLTEGLKYGTPIAKMYGQSLETLNTVMGMLNNAGIVGTSAGTAYTAMMEKLVPASKTLGFAIAHNKDGVIDFGGTLANIHKKFGDFDKASDETKAKLGEAFGRRGIVGVALLADQAGKFADNLAQVNDNAGIAAKSAAIIEAAGSGPLDELIHKYDHAKVALGDALTPVTGPLVERIGQITSNVITWTKANQGLITEKVQGFIDGIANALPGVVKWTERIGTIIGVLGTFALAVKIATGFMAFFNFVATANPWVLLAFALAALTAIVIAFWPEIKKHQEIIGAVAFVVGTLVLALKAQAMWTAITGAVTGGITTLMNGYALATRAGAAASGMATAGLLPLIISLAAVGAAIGAVYLAWTQLTALLNENGGWAGMKAFATGGFAGLDKELNRQAKEEAKKPSAPAGVGADGMPGMGDPMAALRWMMEHQGAAGSVPGMPPMPGMPVAPAPYGPPLPPGMQMPGLPGFPGMPSTPGAAPSATVSPEQMAQMQGKASGAEIAKAVGDALKDSKGEITIKDQTGNATVTKKTAGAFNLRLEASGAV